MSFRPANTQYRVASNVRRRPEVQALPSHGPRLTSARLLASFAVQPTHPLRAGHAAPLPGVRDARKARCDPAISFGTCDPANALANFSPWNPSGMACGGTPGLGGVRQ